MSNSYLFVDSSISKSEQLQHNMTNLNGGVANRQPFKKGNNDTMPYTNQYGVNRDSGTAIRKVAGGLAMAAEDIRHGQEMLRRPDDISESSYVTALPNLKDRETTSENHTMLKPLPGNDASKYVQIAENNKTSYSTNNQDETATNNSATSKPSIMKLPLTPRVTVDQFSSLLTELEKVEIFQFSEIYFVGAKDIQKIGGAKRKNGADLPEWNVRGTNADRKNVNPNSAFDDSRGDMYLTRHDHIYYRYEILSLLGKGSFGQVIKCYDHKSKRNVALKIIRNMPRFEQQGAVEVKVLKRLCEEDPHDQFNYVHLLHHFYFRNHLCLTFDLLGTNLYEWLKAGSFRSINQWVIKLFAQQLLSCVNKLAELKIIHCDLKPENVLLNDVNYLRPSPVDIRSSIGLASLVPLKAPPDLNNDFKKYNITVIDFGSSCFENERLYTYVQSRFYRSPEVILGIPYQAAIDMWSLGCILCELYTGYPLFPGENEQEQLQLIMEINGVPPVNVIEKGSRSKIFFDANNNPKLVPNSKGKKRRPGRKTLSSVINKGNSPCFLNFIERCLEWDPLLRMTPKEALEHPFITGEKSIPSTSSLPTYRELLIKKLKGEPGASNHPEKTQNHALTTKENEITALPSTEPISAIDKSQRTVQNFSQQNINKEKSNLTLKERQLMFHRKYMASMTDIPSVISGISRVSTASAASAKTSRLMTAPSIGTVDGSIASRARNVSKLNSPSANNPPYHPASDESANGPRYMAKPSYINQASGSYSLPSVSSATTAPSTKMTSSNIQALGKGLTIPYKSTGNSHRSITTADHNQHIESSFELHPTLRKLKERRPATDVKPIHNSHNIDDETTDGILHSGHWLPTIPSGLGESNKRQTYSWSRSELHPHCITQSAAQQSAIATDYSGGVQNQPERSLVDPSAGHESRVYNSRYASSVPKNSRNISTAEPSNQYGTRVPKTSVKHTIAPRIVNPYANPVPKNYISLAKKPEHMNRYAIEVPNKSVKPSTAAGLSNEKSLQSWR